MWYIPSHISVFLVLPGESVNHSNLEQETTASVICLFTFQCTEQTFCFTHNAALNEERGTADRCKHLFFHKVLTLCKYELQEEAI
jgi:hypothetical protein